MFFSVTEWMPWSSHGMTTGKRLRQTPNVVVIAGLDPAIHAVAVAQDMTVTEWMPWSSHGMTTVGVMTAGVFS
jgi:hypothetical protein